MMSSGLTLAGRGWSRQFSDTRTGRTLPRTAVGDTGRYIRLREMDLLPLSERDGRKAAGHGPTIYVGLPPTAVLRPERNDLGANQFATNPKPAGSRHRIEPKCRTSVYQSR